MDSVARNHPFVDGNKRAGVKATGFFLLRNGRRPTASQTELKEFVLLGAQSELTIQQTIQHTIQQMTSWFQQFTLTSV